MKFIEVYVKGVSQPVYLSVRTIIDIQPDLTDPTRCLVEAGNGHLYLCETAKALALRINNDVFSAPAPSQEEHS